jgi:predicted N-formylglutamate amidohydrolase
VEIVRPSARSRLVLACDHASNRLPEAVGSLGLLPGEIDTHIGWDIGAAKVARHLSALLDATLVLSGYSRLVIDCNRPTHVAGSIPVVSGGIRVPGNEGLDAVAREERIRTFFEPYHAALSRALDERAGVAGGAVLLVVHSFTPELYGQKRPWHAGMLYGEDTRLAHAFRDWLRKDGSLTVGDNEPYRVSAGTDYTVPVHGEGRGILHTAIEIRQDGVGDEAGARRWAERLAGIWREVSTPG